MSRVTGAQFLEISFTGQQAVKDMLAQWEDPELKKRAQRASTKGANAMKEPLRAAVRPFSKRMAQSVYVHVARADKPASFLGHHRRVAFFWAFVIGGTRAHSLAPRSGDRKRSGYPYVRGVEAHPVIEAVVNSGRQAVYDAIIDDLSKDS